MSWKTTLAASGFAALLVLQADVLQLQAGGHAQQQVFGCACSGPNYGYNINGFCYLPKAPTPYAWGPSCCFAPLRYREFAPEVFPKAESAAAGVSWYRADPVQGGLVGGGFAEVKIEAIESDMIEGEVEEIVPPQPGPPAL